MGVDETLHTWNFSNRSCSRWLSIWCVVVWLALSSIATPQDVALQMLDGSTLSGRLGRLTTQELSLTKQEGEKVIPLSSVGAIRFATNGDNAKPGPLQIMLADGSSLTAQSLVGKGNSWTLESPSFGSVTLSTKSLWWLRFRPIDDSSQLESWNEMVKEQSQSDSLILARPNKELARVGGTIMEAKETQISFEFDDQKLDMPIEKLLGMVWFQAAPFRLRASVDVKLKDQSLWKAESFELVGSDLRLQTSAGQAVNVPVNQLSEIQFGSTNVRWVSELERIESSQQSPASWKFSLDSAKSAFAPRFAHSQPSAKSGSLSEQDLLFIAPGSYVFRMPEGFTKFESRVERPELAEFRSELTIEIWQESTKIVSTVLASDMDFVELKANLSPEKRVKLTVVSSAQSSLGTEVQWKQPRVLR